MIEVIAHFGNGRRLTGASLLKAVQPDDGMHACMHACPPATHHDVGYKRNVLVPPSGIHCQLLDGARKPLIVVCRAKDVREKQCQAVADVAQGVAGREV